MSSGAWGAIQVCSYTQEKMKQSSWNTTLWPQLERTVPHSGNADTIKDPMVSGIANFSATKKHTLFVCLFQFHFPDKKPTEQNNVPEHLCFKHPVCICNKIQTQKGLNERLFILTQTHSMHIFRGIPFIKPQNNT